MKRLADREKTLETLALLAAVSLVFYVVSRRPAFVLLALALLALALLFKGASARLAAGWLRFSEVLGDFNSKVVLGLIYFLFLTPLAFVFRFFNGNAVNTKADPSAASYFEGKERRFGPSDLEKPW
jgi:K+-transporting ATPase A subunit